MEEELVIVRTGICWAVCTLAIIGKNIDVNK